MNGKRSKMNFQFLQIGNLFFMKEIEKNQFDKKYWAFFSSKKEKIQKSTKYLLQKYQRSNQDTLIYQRPFAREGEWIQSGDILADCSTSFGGELCLGKNICIAYMPWEGYNYEDAILISQRLVTEDVYTSIHIESYEVETRSTKLGKEQITKKIPEVAESQLSHLDERGIVKRGASVKEGDILVGKVTPIQKKFVSAYEKLLYTILEKELLPMRDSSLRTPKGLKAKVLEVKILKFSSAYGPENTKNLFSIHANKENKDVEVDFFTSKKTDKNILKNPFFNRKNFTFFKEISFQTDSFFSKNENQQQQFLSFFVPVFSETPKIVKKKQKLFSFFFHTEKKISFFYSK
jgi:DNA-directed RNA polymerase beta subunit